MVRRLLHAVYPDRVISISGGKLLRSIRQRDFVFGAIRQHGVILNAILQQRSSIPGAIQQCCVIPGTIQQRGFILADFLQPNLNLRPA